MGITVETSETLSRCQTERGMAYGAKALWSRSPHSSPSREWPAHGLPQEWHPDRGRIGPRRPGLTLVGVHTHKLPNKAPQTFAVQYNPVFPILGVFRLNGQSKRDDGMIFGSCKASQSPVYPIRDAFLAVNHASCPSLSSSGLRQWGESALKTSRLPGALSLLAKSWLYPPSTWRRR